MPFEAVNEEENTFTGGNFRKIDRQIFNQFGRSYYLGTIHYKNHVTYQSRKIPIFDDDCLLNYPETLRLLKDIRQTLNSSYGSLIVCRLTESSRSIHQNESGLLPISNNGKYLQTSRLLSYIASKHGKLPNKQTNKTNQTSGNFLEFTCGDMKHVSWRLIVDYEFEIVYITLGHYHESSFAALVQSSIHRKLYLEPSIATQGWKVMP